MVSTSAEFTIKPLDEARWPAFASLVENKPAGAVPAGFLFNGALSTYEQLGFSRDRMIGKHRWVVNRFVESSR